MKRQQGQSVVEFALIAPIVFLMIFGMIWGGIMFMEYMHYSNAVRTAARQIAVVNETQRDTTIEAQRVWLQNLWEQEVGVKFYQPNVEIHTTEDKNDVVVSVDFARAVNIPNILDAVDFPPKYIKGLQYRMRLERAATDTTTSTSTGGDTDTEGNTNTEGTNGTGG